MRHTIRPRRARTLRRTAAALAVAALALASAACGTASGAEKSVADHEAPLVIGVKADQPGLGQRQGAKDSYDAYTGFDVDIAKYIAAKLGFTTGEVEFRAVTSGNRESLLRSGAVDMVVASYSITPERERQVLFGGPYYVAHQDILVRSSDTSIRGVKDLAHRKLCKVAGSTSWERVIKEGDVPAVPVAAPDYSACVNLLRDKKIDAVTTDDLILAGYATASNGELRVVNAPFSDERYGVGLRKGDVAGCEAVNKAITSMYQDASAQLLLAQWFGKSGLETTTDVPQFEGCS
ncbi:MAG TPA: glutamate ABC transporter substrate-binding protein [Streptosporangiaceae bacterium]|jgi:glutamate transport system substrate-binding protein